MQASENACPGLEAPTALFFCGLACSGKSTVAHYLEARLPARRYSVDEDVWVRTGLGPMDDGFGQFARQTRERFWELGREALTSGNHVLFDWNLWNRSRRAEWTGRVRRLGFPHRLLYFDVPISELRLRLEARNNAAPDWAVPIPVEELERFAPYFEEPTPDEGVRLLTVRPEDSLETILRRVCEEQVAGEA